MLLAGMAATAGPGAAQSPQSAPEQPKAPEAPATAPAQEALPPPVGQVIIQSHGEPPALATEPVPEPGSIPGSAPGNPAPQGPIADQTAVADLTDTDRSALKITAYDLDARLRPTTSGLAVRAQVTVQNTSGKPLKQLALQISSSLRWESASLVRGEVRTTLPVAQHRLDTDADHTGAETELILALPEPLAAGASATLDLFYTGTVPASAARLARLGASAAQQQAADWDAISPSWTGLRGFGNVLWYPVASPQLFLAEGNALFQAVGHTRLQEQDASVRLRLGVEYSGEPPLAAYFCGRREVLHAITDAPDSATAAGTGIASATFATEPLGFRTPNLFVLQQPEVFADPPGTQAATPAAPPPGPAAPATGSSTPKTAQPDSAAGQNTSSSASDSSSSSDSSPSSDWSPYSSSSAESASDENPVQPLLRRAGGLSDSMQPFLAMEGAGPAVVQSFPANAYRSSALLREWLGPQPLSALTAIDHEGQPFEDGPLLVAPLGALTSPLESPVLIQSLTHAWVQTGQPWMDDGLAQFFALLWIERQDGRDAALARLTDLMKPVALAEPDPTAGTPALNAEPLISASNELVYRRKAAAVWWMLRGIVGDGNLHAALSAWRVQPLSQDSSEAQAVAFEHLLERLSHQELGWFFADWVLHDKGLPDLTVFNVSVAVEPATPGRTPGWLVAVTVRNEGGAVADVPLVVRSGRASVSRRIRIPGQATVTERVLVEFEPASVTVNDGGTPEQRQSTHTSDLHLSVR